MLEEDILTRFYAYNAYFYFFYDTDLVEKGFFGTNSTIEPNQQTAIYNNDLFGLDDQWKLCYWVVAADPANVKQT